jgi:hypothetical protein
MIAEPGPQPPTRSVGEAFAIPPWKGRSGAHRLRLRRRAKREVAVATRFFSSVFFGKVKFFQALIHEIVTLSTHFCPSEVSNGGGGLARGGQEVRDGRCVGFPRGSTGVLKIGAG